MTNELENRWKNPDACDLCGKVGKTSWQEHVSVGIVGFTFIFCEECGKDGEKCNCLIREQIQNHINERRKRNACSPPPDRS